MTAAEVEATQYGNYNPESYCRRNPELSRALEMIASGYFCPEECHRYQDLVDALLKQGDPYRLLADFDSYVACQDKVSALYCDSSEWAKRAILNVAGMGKFSSDRTIREYAERIWHVSPVQTTQKIEP